LFRFGQTSFSRETAFSCNLIGGVSKGDTDLYYLAAQEEYPGTFHGRFRSHDCECARVFRRPASATLDVPGEVLSDFRMRFKGIDGRDEEGSINGK
jgi:hypothetical protein